MWLPACDAVTATALPARAAGEGEATLLLSALASVEHILRDARGLQHVVLRGNGAAMQLLIRGADVAAEPVVLRFSVPGLGAIGDACRDLSRLRRILSPAPPPLPLPGWTPTRLKLRDALIALDGRAAGASHRDIAAVLHGSAFVSANWELGLKERVRRHLTRGLTLAGGGYRALLRY